MIGRLIGRLTRGMRYPHIFLVLLGLLAVNLVVPDPIPLIDEAVLALLTLLVSRLRTRRGEPGAEPAEEPEPPRDITSRGATLD